MTTIFPAPGTITSNNSYIFNWYIYDKPALQHPTVVKARTDIFVTVESDDNAYNLETYASEVYGEFKFDVILQSLEYATTNTNTAAWNTFDKPILSYTTTLATTITLYFVNRSYPTIPFKTGSTVRVSSKVSGYSKIFTVLTGKTNSITLNFDTIPPSSLVIDNINESVYYQSRFSLEPVASVPRTNLRYSAISPFYSPSIRIPDISVIQDTNSNLKFFSVNTQTAIAVFKEVLAPRSADTVNKLKVDLKPIEVNTVPVTLSTYASDIAGQYKFNIVSQTPSYLTVNTSTLTWYIFDKDILLYSAYTPTTSTIRFNNTTPFVPFAAGSTIRIKNKFSTYSETFTVLTSTATSIIITYTEFNPVGATIDNMYETVYYQSNTLRDLNSSSIARRNFLKSITPAISPSITIPYAESFREVKSTISSNTIQKPITVIKDVTTTVKTDIINKVKIQTAEIVTTVISNKLETHTALVSGEYTYPVKSRNVDVETFNTSVVDWYIFNSFLTYDVRQATSITMYFDTPYYQQFIPFPTNSIVRISNKLWYSEFVTVLNGTTNSITINFIPNLPFNLYIDNIVETVYNQDQTYRNLSTASDSRKKLFYSVMGGGLTNLPVDTVRISVDDKIVNSGNIAKQIANLSTVNTDISSADITKQLFKLSGDTDNLQLSNIDILKIKDFIQSTSVDESHELTHFDSLVDGVFVQVDGQPIRYNVVNWYIDEINILTKTYVLESTTTLRFSTSSIWKLFLENQYVRIKQPAVNYTQDVLVLSSTITSITFDTPIGFPTTYTGMTINHLYSPIYAQTLVDVAINPPNLTLPRENLAAASNISFTSVFPYGKLGYNARGTNLFITLGNDLTSGLEVSISAKLNSYDSVKSGLSKYVLGQPVKYNVVNWYINELDNRLTSTLTIGATTTINFENTFVLRPFLENQYVQIEHPLVGFKQDILVTSSTTTSITFNTVVGFPTNYTGMTISQLYSSVYPQSLVDNAYSSIINPTNLTLPRENLAASKNTGFVSLFPISKLVYNARGTYAITPYMPVASSTEIDTAKSLKPYDLIEDGLSVYVVGQPITYNVVNWYITELSILTGTPNAVLSTTTLVFDNTEPKRLFKADYYVRITQGTYKQDILLTSTTVTSVTFDTPNGFPTNYTGMLISRLYSPISKQSVVNDQFSNLIKPTNLTTPQENLAASLLKPNSRGYQIIFGGIESFSNFTVDVNARGRLELFEDTRLPGDFDTVISSSSVVSYTTNATTSDWYTFDQEILSYNTTTTDYATITFTDYGFIPFKTGTTVKIISNNITFFATVFTGASSYIMINHQGYTILSNGRIQQAVTSVYPQSYVVTTVAPILPRENLYYMRLRSSTSLDAYFQQPVAVPQMASLSKQITAVKGDSGISNQRGSIDQLQINSVSNVDRSTNVTVLSNVTVLKPVITNTSLLVLKYLPTVVGEGNNQKNGVVNKFLVNRISEIGRETVITVPSTKISPIQFWN